MSEDPVLHSSLENARRELLDLTARNRLLNTTRSSARSSRLEIVDEVSDEVYRRLITEGKAMGFLSAGKEEHAEGDGEENQLSLFQPEDDEVDETGRAQRHVDDKLQTDVTSDQLQKRLLKLFYDARTFQEEQGVNILYLALGFLKWYEDDNSDRERFAPLLLVPVVLDRQSAASRFKIRYTEGDINTNLSLQARLKSDFGIELPDAPDIEELSPSDYCAAVAAAVQGQPRWEVVPNDLVLWFFSFSKFLMYRDLDPANWPEDRRLENHPLIGAILRHRFRDDLPLCGENDNIDSLIHPIDMVHVLEADSSQALVIEEVKRGRNLVIQGPPGTGKSQTIANLIAAAVKEGKSVLFMAEKMAALEVVRRRLANIGLDDMCLELHSNKAKKRAVLQDLERTLGLGEPHVDDVQRHCGELNNCRERLNRHLQVIHTPIEPSGVTPYQVVGELVRLRAAGTKPPEFKLENPCQWSRAEFRARLNLLRDLVESVEETGAPRHHAWCGVELDVALPTDVDRVAAKIPGILARLHRMDGAGQRLANALGVPTAVDAMGTSRFALLAQRLDMAPPMDRRSLGSPVWQERRHHIDNLVEAGKQYSECRRQLDGIIIEAGWDTDVTSVRRNLAAHGRSWFRFFRRAFRKSQVTLGGILVDEPPKKLEDRLAILDSLIQGQKVRDFIESSSAAELGREAFGSYWNGTASDWSALSTIAKWESECRKARIDSEFLAIHSRLQNGSDIRTPLAQIGKDLKPVLEELTGLFESVRLNLSVAFDSTRLYSIPLDDLAAKLRQWQAEPESLSCWVNYFVRRRRFESEGMSELAAQIDSGQTTASEAIACCEMSYYEELIRASFHNQPELASFSGASHEHLIEKFKKLDEARIDLARHEVAIAHFERLPGADSDIGEVGLVRREIQKKRRHLAIRKLLAQAGRAVQAIKPVFMMSPISVAQYTTLRKAEMIPPVEIRKAVSALVQVHHWRVVRAAGVCSVSLLARRPGQAVQRRQISAVRSMPVTDVVSESAEMR
jgi:hypothetical protein